MGEQNGELDKGEKGRVASRGLLHWPRTLMEARSLSPSRRQNGADWPHSAICHSKGRIQISKGKEREKMPDLKE